MTFWWTVLAVGAVAMLLCAFFVLPGELVADSLSEKARLKAQHDVRTAGIQLVGGIVVAVGSLLTVRTLEVTRQGQIAERFATAMNLLKEPTTRVGGVHALERIVRDSRLDRTSVQALMGAYVRERVPRTDPATDAGKMPTDVEAVLRILTRRPRRLERSRPIDLSELDLRGWRAPGAFLEEANLAGALLDGAVLTGARLAKAAFVSTVLRGAHLEDARLDGAWLTGANLERANLRRANLTGAELADARLQGADLRGAVGARLGAAQLDGMTTCPDGSAGPKC